LEHTVDRAEVTAVVVRAIDVVMGISGLVITRQVIDSGTLRRDRCLANLGTERAASEMPFVETNDDVSLFYRDWGGGEPVVFCAAWALSSISLQYQMLGVVDSGRRAVAYDRRGHGRSDDPGRGYDYDTLGEDLASVLERLDLREVTLVAHSMGSGDAVRYLTRYGAGRVGRLVLLAPTTPFLLRTPDNRDGVDAELFEGSRNDWRRDFGRWILENEDPYFGAGLPNCDVSSLLRDWTRADMLATSLQAVIDFQRSASETDFREELTRLAVPTLVIQGDADASAPLALTGVRTAQLIPNCRLVVYENAPHGLYLTHRERLNRDLLAFIENDSRALAAGSSTAAA
jgi:non-heme chloroperoxidase